MQPYFLPYIGYWQLLHAADTFLILDDVSYINRGWINRNRIFCNGSPTWMTVPLQGASQNRDICDIEPSSIESYDILCAGFPCQPFSQAGHHKGFKDSRGTMFSQVMRFVKTNIPKVVILENVQALLNHDKGKSFAKIKEELEKEGYSVVYNVIKCSDYGIPQMRKRLFIVGFKNIEVNDLDNFFKLDKYKKNTTLSDYLGQNFKKDVAYTLRCGGKHSPIDDRHNWDGYWVDDKEYRLTIDDGLKLQGFYNYDFVGNKNEKWKMLGNTIPTIFTEIIGKQIIKHTSFNSNV